jgi:hypothetical protein
MSLLQVLKNAGNKLGLITVAHVPDPAAPTKITMRTVTLRDLITEMRAAEVQALADATGGLNVQFDEIFAAAGVKTPAHGWTVAKLEAFLAENGHKGMAREEMQKRVVEALASQKVPVEDLVKDAMARDKAIDAYGAFAYGKLHSGKEGQAREKAQLEEQIAGLKEQISRIEQEEKAADERWKQWWQRKVAYEKEMAGAVSYLLKEPIVTIDDAMPGEHNSS